MPLYEYQCESCGHRFEVIQKFSDDLVSVCPNCGKGPVVKLLSSPAIQFKGSGWYITDYARKDSGKDSGKESGKDSGKSTGSSSGSNDTSKSSGSGTSDSSEKSSTPAKTDTSTPKSDSK
jgi:putative FmdB family regulatory protein